MKYYWRPPREYSFSLVMIVRVESYDDGDPLKMVLLHLSSDKRTTWVFFFLRLRFFYLSSGR